MKRELKSIPLKLEEKMKDVLSLVVEAKEFKELKFESEYIQNWYDKYYEKHITVIEQSKPIEFDKERIESFYKYIDVLIKLEKDLDNQSEIEIVQGLQVILDVARVAINEAHRKQFGVGLFNPKGGISNEQN